MRMTKARYVILWLMVVLYGLLLCSCNHSEKAFTVNGLAVEKAERLLACTAKRRGYFFPAERVYYTTDRSPKGGTTVR